MADRFPMAIPKRAEKTYAEDYHAIIGHSGDPSVIMPAAAYARLNRLRAAADTANQVYSEAMQAALEAINLDPAGPYSIDPETRVVTRQAQQEPG